MFKPIVGPFYWEMPYKIPMKSLNWKFKIFPVAGTRKSLSKFSLHLLQQPIKSILTFKCVDLLALVILDYIDIGWNYPLCERIVIILMIIDLPILMLYSESTICYLFLRK